ncbi:hypothetical protein [Pseudomonas aeruginosa]|uniref:hypothetical protein n=1 Tax=Pseudomonas aeruginosa TaxID=287 RepID=UPI0022BA67E6|nr:hypothetical protein [Pseudomonas aeruginosa]HCF4373738.1 hypothetical protein [Pseudomonas aeruginosa]
MAGLTLSHSWWLSFWEIFIGKLNLTLLLWGVVLERFVRFAVRVGLIVVLLALILVGYFSYLKFIKIGGPLEVFSATACGLNESCQDQVVVLKGTIEPNSAEETFSALQEYLSRNPVRDTVCLDSRGGDVDASVKLASMIHREGLNTCVLSSYKISDGSDFKSYCQSSCVWVSLAGKENILYDGAVLGFHAARKQDYFGNIIGIDCDGFEKFKELIGSVVKEKGRQDQLVDLLKWSFDQGSGPETTDCRAQQVQKRYQYFTKIKGASGTDLQGCKLERQVIGWTCNRG